MSWRQSLTYHDVSLFVWVALKGWKGIEIVCIDHPPKAQEHHYVILVENRWWQGSGGCGIPQLSIWSYEMLIHCMERIVFAITVAHMTIQIVATYNLFVFLKNKVVQYPSPIKNDYPNGRSKLPQEQGGTGHFQNFRRLHLWIGRWGMDGFVALIHSPPLEHRGE